MMLTSELCQGTVLRAMQTWEIAEIVCIVLFALLSDVIKCAALCIVLTTHNCRYSLAIVSCTHANAKSIW